MSVVGATIRLKSKPIQIHARLGTVVRAEVMPRIQGTEQDSPPEPHDSDSCPVCIAAFAVTTAEFHPLPMISLDLVRRLPFPSFSAPELYSPYRLPSRGPPFV